MYCGFAPYYDFGDDLLAIITQIGIFFSLVSSIITSALLRFEVTRVSTF